VRRGEGEREREREGEGGKDTIQTCTHGGDDKSIVGKE
jgi:hypothetical protein